MIESESPNAEQLRASMECVVLPPRPGARPSERPPVEIFLGTEPAQFRANRVFGYSIEKVRDPGREVRIHLMSELAGFDRRGWTTGFTNYRFAIPAFCGGRGRAVYNDEDEIYLSDPGRLFDLDLAGAGYLAISDTESSVMLIDCERMAPVWSLKEAQQGWKRALLRKASRATGHRGELDPHWNARDEEFVPGRSHLLHYTTLHTQPWRPFPERFVYQEGAYTQLWHELEREAIAHGFELFRREAPSKLFAAHRRRLEGLLRGELPSAIGSSDGVARAFEALARQTKSRGAIELLPDLRGIAEERPGRFGLDVERRLGLLEWLAEAPAPASEDGIVCVDGLDGIPVWDVPWVVDSLFERARRFVFVAVRCRELPPRRFMNPPSGTVFTPDWWRAHFDAAAVRHPGVRWELVTTRGRDFERDGHRVAFGGPRQDATPPRIWTLSDGEPGHELAVQALANALGGARRAPGGDSGGGEDAAQGREPAPDLLIVAGRAAARRARRIREQARGRCLVVALGAGAALPIDEVDLAIVLPGETIFPHPKQLVIDLPPAERAGGSAASPSCRPSARPGPIEALRARITDAVVARAQARPANNRGTTRPQEGLEWFCARLVERGLVRPMPPRDLGGFARAPEPVLEAVAQRVRALLGVDGMG